MSVETIPTGWTPTYMTRKTKLPGRYGWRFITMRVTETMCWTVYWGGLTDDEHVYPTIEAALAAADSLAELAGGWKE